jgi:hypothetical protein
MWRSSGPDAVSILSAIRSTAERARGFAVTSASPGRTRPQSRKVAAASGAPVIGCLAALLPLCSEMNCLTMRSSMEWKLMTAMRPPGTSRRSATSSARESSPLSLLV